MMDKVRAKSREYFRPDFDSVERQSTTASAIFNLVSTIVGGGVLSLPYAFSLVGVGLGTLMLVVTAIASDFSIYILVSCSRRSGSKTYEQVAARAFGPLAKPVVQLMVFLLTVLILVAYTVLLKQLLSPLVDEYIFPHEDIGQFKKNLVAVACVLLISPACFQRSVTALSRFSFFSICSVLILAVIIFIRSFQRVDEWPSFDADAVNSIVWFNNDFEAVVKALPIFVCSYVCHFNVLPVHGELLRPTRRRLKRVVHCTVLCTSIFYFSVGLIGHFYCLALAQPTEDNILNSFSKSDGLVNIGRASLFVSILVSVPLVTLPCREALRGLLRCCYAVARPGPGGDDEGENYKVPATAVVVFSDTEDELLIEAGELPLLAADNAQVAKEKAQLPAMDATHFVLTIALLVTMTTLGVILSNVSVVWDVMGSTISIIIAFMLPTASYIRIRTTRPNTDRRKMTAWVLLGAATMVFVVCTVGVVWLISIGNL